MKKTYLALQGRGGVTSLMLASAVLAQKCDGLLEDDARCLWQIEADSWEEAMAIHHLRMGFEPYAPMGEGEPCPHCGAVYYPLGSGECWRCG